MCISDDDDLTFDVCRHLTQRRKSWALPQWWRGRTWRPVLCQTNWPWWPTYPSSVNCSNTNLCHPVSSKTRLRDREASCIIGKLHVATMIEFCAVCGKRDWLLNVLLLLYHTIPHELCRCEVKDVHGLQSFVSTHCEESDSLLFILCLQEQMLLTSAFSTENSAISSEKCSCHSKSSPLPPGS